MKLSVYTILGEQVKIIVDGVQESGEHIIMWDGKDSYGDLLPSAVYFLRLETEDLASTEKMVLFR
jgi:hypothetical protein